MLLESKLHQLDGRCCLSLNYTNLWQHWHTQHFETAHPPKKTHTHTHARARPRPRLRPTCSVSLLLERWQLAHLLTYVLSNQCMLTYGCACNSNAVWTYVFRRYRQGSWWQGCRKPLAKGRNNRDYVHLLLRPADLPERQERSWCTRQLPDPK